MKIWTRFPRYGPQRDYMKEALNVSDVAFNLWISPLVPESFDGQTAKFTCPTSYKIQIITTRYDGVIKEALTAVMGFDDIEVIYLFKPQETDDEKEQSEEKITCPRVTAQARLKIS